MWSKAYRLNADTCKPWGAPYDRLRNLVHLVCWSHVDCDIMEVDGFEPQCHQALFPLWTRVGREIGTGCEVSACQLTLCSEWTCYISILTILVEMLCRREIQLDILASSVMIYTYRCYCINTGWMADGDRSREVKVRCEQRGENIQHKSTVQNMASCNDNKWCQYASNKVVVTCKVYASWLPLSLQSGVETW